MQVSNLQLFPTLVQEINNFLTEDECTTIVNHINHSKLTTHAALDGHATSTFSNQKYKAVNELNKFVPFKEKLLRCLNNYSEESGITKVKLVNSWISIQSKNSKLAIHTHPYSVLSCVIYLKVDNASSKLYFKNPNPFYAFTAIVEEKIVNAESIYFTPENGKLIIFPSWLQHGSNDINQSEQRIILSANTAAAD